MHVNGFTRFPHEMCIELRNESTIESTMQVAILNLKNLNISIWLWDLPDKPVSCDAHFVVCSLIDLGTTSCFNQRIRRIVVNHLWRHVLHTCSKTNGDFSKVLQVDRDLQCVQKLGGFHI